MNPTYDKMKRKLQRIDSEIENVISYQNNYMPNGIQGHEWEYISLAKELIATIKGIINE